MLAFGMSMRMLGPVEWLTNELESTRSSSRRAQLIRKLALSHDPSVIPTIAPFLGADGRVRRAAIDGILHFGEDARRPMLDLLGDLRRSELHPGALRVLVGIVAGAHRATTAEESR